MKRHYRVNRTDYMTKPASNGRVALYSEGANGWMSLGTYTDEAAARRAMR